MCLSDLALSRMAASASTTMLNKKEEKGSPCLTPHHVVEDDFLINVNSDAAARYQLHDPGDLAVIEALPL